MIINIYSVTEGGSLKIDQFFAFHSCYPWEKCEYLNFFKSDLSRNLYEYYLGSPRKSGQVKEII